MNAVIGNILLLTFAAQSPDGGRLLPPPDLEVVGRLKNLEYAAVDDPQDLLGHGWITARLRISRVVRGRSPLRLIIIHYLAHTYRNERLPVQLRLRANVDGTYTVCATPGGDGLMCG